MDEPINPKYKEFTEFFFRADASRKYKSESQTLKLRRHQMIMSTFMNPSKPGNNRLLMSHSMGSGKSKGLIGIAQNFIRIYHQMRKRATNVMPQVYVLGYSKNIFIDALMTTPEYGYISVEEVKKYNELFENWNKSRGRADAQVHYREYNDYYLRLRNRISSSQMGGYYKFIGFIEFSNKLGFKENGIDINQQFVEQLKYSLIIADEVHNCYNTDALNMTGEALKYVLNYHGADIWFVGASGTVISNSPTEIIDLTSILTGLEINKDDLFKFDNVNKTIAVNHSALDGLKRILRGKVSVFEDVDPTAYPSYEFIGSNLPMINIALAPGSPPFKFVRCKVDPNGLQNKLLNEYTTNDIYIADYIIRDVVVDGMTILPESNENSELVKKEQETNEFGVVISTEKRNNTGYVVLPPNYSLPEFSQLKMHAVKYYELTQILPTLRGKTLIFHNRVNTTGIKYIESIMRHMGYIQENEENSMITPCVICGVQYQNHKKENKNHEYMPARYNMIYSELDDLEVRTNMKKFNHPSNCPGYQIQFQLGSEKILEAIDYSCLQNIVVMSFPDNFPSLLQLLWRGIRRDSHKHMISPYPPIKIFIMVTSFGDSVQQTIEEKIYARKFNWYIGVREISQMLDEISINRHIDENLPSNFKYEDEHFFAYNFYHFEENIIRYLINMAFSEFAILTYDDLWNFIKDHPEIRIDLNSKYFSQELFNVILTKMVTDEKRLIQYGEYYAPPQNIFLRDQNKIQTKQINVNIVQIMTNSLAAKLKKSPDISLFKSFNGDIHINVIKAAIRNSDTEIIKFYNKYKLAAASYYIDLRFNIRYVYNTQDDIFIAETIDPDYNNIVGYYESGSFKIVDLRESKTHDDQRRNRRGMACKSINKEELIKIMKRLDLGRDDTLNTNSRCQVIEEALLKMHARSTITGTVYFSYLGRPSL